MLPFKRCCQTLQYTSRSRCNDRTVLPLQAEEVAAQSAMADRQDKAVLGLLIFLARPAFPAAALAVRQPLHEACGDCCCTTPCAAAPVH